MKRQLALVVFTIAASVTASILTLRSAEASGTPGFVPVQGCVRQADGTALNGEYQVNFRLYTGSSVPIESAINGNGNGENQVIQFRDCVFSTALHPPVDSILNNSEMYLGVSVGADQEMTPRSPIGSAPYAVQAQHADRATRADNGVPAGTIVPFAGTNVPEGWLLCDGATVDPIIESRFVDLRSAIGDAWGDGGDGSGPRFQVPDLRGMFLRGHDGTRQLDPDATIRTASNPGGVTGNKVGSRQNDGIGPHEHSIPDFIIGGNQTPHHIAGGFATGGTSFYWDIKSGAVLGGGVETRPVNVSVNYIIKY